MSLIMEDTKSLLVMVLQKVFHDRPEVVENTYKLIYNFNNGKRDKNDYIVTLKTICDWMNDELPSQILVYLLTLVDMPLQQDEVKLPLVEKMQITQNFLPEKVRPHLLEYLQNHKKPMEIKNNASANTSDKLKESETQSKSSHFDLPKKRRWGAKKDAENFIKPVKRTRNRRKLNKNDCEDIIDENPEPVKKLLDITACYVIKNEQYLKQLYKIRLDNAWGMINSNQYSGPALTQCYETVKDLNKKIKLLRMIENDNITDDIFFEEYKNSDIFLRERHMLDELTKDPMHFMPQVREQVDLFFKSINNVNKD